MQKKKNESGITLLVLAITIVVLLIIGGVTIANGKKAIEFQKYANLKEDIEKLTECIGSAYSLQENISEIGPKYMGNLDFLNGTMGKDNYDIKNPNDGPDYYVIGISNLNSATKAKVSKLKYGKNNYNYSSSASYNSVQNTYSGNDVYIINGVSHTIYYTDGIQYNGKTYYRLSEKYTLINE